VRKGCKTRGLQSTPVSPFPVNAIPEPSMGWRRCAGPELATLETPMRIAFFIFLSRI